MTVPAQFVCPQCQQHLKVAGAAGGKQVRCPRCHAIVRVPDTDQTAVNSSQLWVVRTDDGRTYGPVSRAELSAWVNEGRVYANCQISPEGACQWMWAAELFPQLAASGPGPAGPAFPPACYAPVSPRSRLTAGLLGILLPLVGVYGVHRLYLGHIWLGILMMVTCGGCGIWQLIDVILVFAGSVTDARGLPLRE